MELRGIICNLYANGVFDGFGLVALRRDQKPLEPWARMNSDSPPSSLTEEDFNEIVNAVSLEELSAEQESFIFQTARLPADPPSIRRSADKIEDRERRITKTVGELKQALQLQLPAERIPSTDPPSGRPRHQNQDVLKALLKIVEGSSKPLASEPQKPLPGRLNVDQSLPVPRLYEVKRTVLSLGDNGGTLTLSDAIAFQVQSLSDARVPFQSRCCRQLSCSAVNLYSKF